MFYKQQYWKKKREKARKQSQSGNFEVRRRMSQIPILHTKASRLAHSLLPLRELSLPTSCPKRVPCQRAETNKPWVWLKLDGLGHYSPKCACPKTHVTGTQIPHVTPFHCRRAVTILSVWMWTQSQPEETSGRQEKREEAILTVS